MCAETAEDEARRVAMLTMYDATPRDCDVLGAAIARHIVDAGPGDERLDGVMQAVEPIARRRTNYDEARVAEAARETLKCCPHGDEEWPLDALDVVLDGLFEDHGS